MRKPVMHKLCIFQTRLLTLPAKTPGVMEQLAEEEDDRQGAAATWAKLTVLERGIQSTEVRSDRSMLVSKQKDYAKLTQHMHDPSWQPDDSRLMYALMWAADDGKRLRDGLVEGGAALKDMFARTISADPQSIPVPDGRSVTTGKDLVFSLAKGDVPDTGIVEMLYEE